MILACIGAYIVSTRKMPSFPADTRMLPCAGPPIKTKTPSAIFTVSICCFPKSTPWPPAPESHASISTQTAKPRLITENSPLAPTNMSQSSAANGLYQPAFTPAGNGCSDPTELTPDRNTIINDLARERAFDGSNRKRPGQLAPVQPYGKLVMYVAERILEILDLGLATIKFL